MKKFLSLALVLVMMMSLSLTAFAAETTTTGDNVTIDINAMYNGGADKPEVISADIKWGAMQFTYNVGGTMDWDATEHAYVDNTTSSWTATGNTVTVTNHSNVAIKAELSFAAEPSYYVTGTFNKTELLLASGDGLTYDNADNDTVELTLRGPLSSTVNQFTKVGTITVKIGKQ